MYNKPDVLVRRSCRILSFTRVQAHIIPDRGRDTQRPGRRDKIADVGGQDGIAVFPPKYSRLGDADCRAVKGDGVPHDDDVLIRCVFYDRGYWNMEQKDVIFTRI